MTTTEPGVGIADMETGEVIAAMTPKEAREVTIRIATAMGVTWELIVDAYERRAWAALGHPTWDAYTDAEFGHLRVKLPRENRQEVVASMREAGLSIRAIAAAIDVDAKTVRNDLAGGENSPPDGVTGTDGKQYESKAVREARERREREAAERQAAEAAASAERAAAQLARLAAEANESSPSTDRAVDGFEADAIGGDDDAALPSTAQSAPDGEPPTEAPSDDPHTAAVTFAAVAAVLTDVIDCQIPAIDPAAFVRSIPAEAREWVMGALDDLRYWCGQVAKEAIAQAHRED